MIKKNKNIFIFLTSVVISVFGCLIMYYIKTDEIEKLKYTNLKLENENKHLKKKIQEYKLIVSKI
tara:strand:+ start:3941 stop:4135 length:195 start_codon:yes stop_codon:yes gene_type:complete